MADEQKQWKYFVQRNAQQIVLHSTQQIKNSNKSNSEDVLAYRRVYN